MSNGRTNEKNLTTTTRHTIVQSIIDSLPFLSVKEKQETNESSNDDDDEDELR
jgi:hypothetical protein